MQDVLWTIVVTAARDDPRNVQLGLLTQTLNDTIDISAMQSAALQSHVPTAILNLVLIMSLLSAVFLGLTLARPRPPQSWREWPLAKLALRNPVSLADSVPL